MTGLNDLLDRFQTQNVSVEETTTRLVERQEELKALGAEAEEKRKSLVTLAGTLESTLLAEVSAQAGRLEKARAAIGSQDYRAAVAYLQGLDEVPTEKVKLSYHNGVVRATDTISGEEVWKSGNSGFAQEMKQDAQRVYLIGERSIEALKKDSGEKVWGWKIKDDGYSRRPFICKSEIVDDKLVVMDSRDITVLDTQTGKEKWHFDGEAHFEKSFITPEKIYVLDSRKLTVINANDGHIDWSTRSDTLHGFEVVPSGVLLYDGYNDSKAISSCQGSNKARWKKSFALLGNGYAASFAHDGEQGYVIDNKKRLEAFDLASGETRWVKDLPIEVTSLVSGNDCVYLHGYARSPLGANYLFGHSAKLVCLNKKEGAEVWEKKSQRDKGELTVEGDTVFLDKKSRCAEAYDAKTGEERK